MLIVLLLSQQLRDTNISIVMSLSLLIKILRFSWDLLQQLGNTICGTYLWVAFIS